MFNGEGDGRGDSDSKHVFFRYAKYNITHHTIDSRLFSKKSKIIVFPFHILVSKTIKMDWIKEFKL